MINIIIGKNSNLSRKLSKELCNSVLISTNSAIIEIEKLNLTSKNFVNIIFNNFQKSTLLNDITSPSEYINRSIYTTAQILEYIKENNIKVNKLIYTSSSSVYGDNILCKETDICTPFNLHASLKLANEKIIEMFCKENNIDYVIARIFNLYGGNDSFSIIKKIQNAYEKDINLKIVNNGNAIRDFIHINDVVKIYKIILDEKNIGIINIGTGEGKSIRNILDFLKNKNIIVNTNNVNKNEIKVSTSNRSKLNTLIKKFKFIDVNEYLLDTMK